MSKFLEILKKTLQAYQKHIIVFDNDEIFSYPEIQSEAQEAGYQLIFVKDAYDFRINYELNKISGGRIAFISNCTFPVLPDILQETKIISIHLRDFIPFLDTNALTGLSFSVLNTLSGNKIYDYLGFNDTIKFVLENIYNVDFDTLKSGRGKERLLNALITFFIEKNSVNRPISYFLSKQTKPFFPELQEVELSKKAILDFVDLKWKAWIN